MTNKKQTLNDFYGTANPLDRGLDKRGFVQQGLFSNEPLFSNTQRPFELVKITPKKQIELQDVEAKMINKTPQPQEPETVEKLLAFSYESGDKLYLEPFDGWNKIRLSLGVFRLFFIVQILMHRGLTTITEGNAQGLKGVVITAKDYQTVRKETNQGRSIKELRENSSVLGSMQFSKHGKDDFEFVPLWAYFKYDKGKLVAVPNPIFWNWWVQNTRESFKTFIDLDAFGLNDLGLKIYLKLVFNYRANFSKKSNQKNKVSNETLMRCTGLTEESVLPDKNGRRKLKRDIADKIDKAIDKLEELGLITKVEPRRKSGVKITQEELEKYSFEDWKSWLYHYEPNQNWKDQKELLEFNGQKVEPIQ